MRRASTPARPGARRSQTRAAASPSLVSFDGLDGIGRCYLSRRIPAAGRDIMRRPRTKPKYQMQRLIRLALLLGITTLARACAAVAVADAAVTVAATAVKVTAKGVGAVADAVIPDGDDEDEDD